MEKTAPSTPSKGIDFAPGLSVAASSLNPKKIDPAIYRQVAIFVGAAILLAAGFYGYLRIGQEPTVRRQQKAEETQTAVQDKKFEKSQLASTQDQQRKNDVTMINTALKTYFLNEKKTSGSLQELVPKYLGELSTDPKTKKDYNYKPAADQKSWQVTAVLSDGTSFEVKGP